jgi:hypothetical protein
MEDSFEEQLAALREAKETGDISILEYATALAQLRAARREGLGLVEGLRAHLTDVIHPHQRPRQAALRLRQGGGFRGARLGCDGARPGTLGVRAPSERSQRLVEAGQQAVGGVHG